MTDHDDTRAWKSIESAPQCRVVFTKIHDEYGCRNVQPLIRRDNLWFFPGYTMYVYYQPTHWTELTADD